MEDARSSSLEVDRWVGSFPMPRDSVFAIGVIALNYNQLENLFSCVFSEVVDLDLSQSELIFRKIGNDVRASIVRQSLRLDTREDLKDCVNHYLKGFELCASNRHDLMHSASNGNWSSRVGDGGGMVLAKYQRSGQQLCCLPSVAELKEIADAMESYSIYGAHLSAAFAFDRLALEQGKPSPRLAPILLEKRPARPRTLRWVSAPQNHSDPLPPPPYLE